MAHHVALSLADIHGAVFASTQTAAEHVSTAVSMLPVTYLGAPETIIGIRIPAVAIPRGATILTAALEFTPAMPLEDPTVSLSAKIQLSFSNYALTTDPGSLSTLVYFLGVGVAWDLTRWGDGEAVVRSADISDLLQGFVQRSTWSSGLPLMSLLTIVSIANETGYG
jgi:hypothetical protein